MTKLTQPSVNSWPIRLLIWLTAIHTIRILLGALGIFTALSGGPTLFFISGTGDFLVGLLAPLLALVLAERIGLGLWVSTLVWNIVGLADIINGNLIALLDPAIAAQNPPTFLLIIPVVLSIAHIASVFLLMRAGVIYHYVRDAFQQIERSIR